MNCWKLMMFAISSIVIPYIYVYVYINISVSNLQLHTKTVRSFDRKLFYMKTFATKSVEVVIKISLSLSEFQRGRNFCSSPIKPLILKPTEVVEVLMRVICGIIISFSLFLMNSIFSDFFIYLRI